MKVEEIVGVGGFFASALLYLGLFLMKRPPEVAAEITRVEYRAIGSKHL